MLQSSAYLTKQWLRRSSSRSSSSSTRFDSSGESGPPCGVPSSTGPTSPSSITPAVRNARISLSILLSASFTPALLAEGQPKLDFLPLIAHRVAPPTCRFLPFGPSSTVSGSAYLLTPPFGSECLNSLADDMD